MSYLRQEKHIKTAVKKKKKINKHRLRDTHQHLQIIKQNRKKYPKE